MNIYPTPTPSLRVSQGDELLPCAMAAQSCKTYTTDLRWQQSPVSITPPGTLKSLAPLDLLQWGEEIRKANNIPLDHVSSWRRKCFVPSWVLAKSNKDLCRRTLQAKKRSFWKPSPYRRELHIMSDQSGPVEFQTVHPTTKAITNRWPAHEMLSVVTVGNSVLVAFPGRMLQSRTHLEIVMLTPEAAVALASDWGWEAEIPANPPVLPSDCEDAFRFKH